MSIALNIKALRDIKRMTQKSLANELGIPVTTLSNYEVGKSEPSIEIMIKLSSIFGVTIDYLVDNPNFKDMKKIADISIDNSQTTSDMALLLREKDLRIEDLKNRVDDKERLLQWQQDTAAFHERVAKRLQDEYDRLKRLHPEQD